MNLSAPTVPVFIIAVVIAVLGILAGAGIFSVIPVAPFWLVTIGFIILALGQSCSKASDNQTGLVIQGGKHAALFVGFHSDKIDRH